jgi:hypothetical protein
MKDRSIRAATDRVEAAVGDIRNLHLVRLNVNLNPETAEALRVVAEARGISLTEAVRRAVAIYKYIEDEIAADRKVLTEDARGRHRRELVLL